MAEKINTYIQRKDYLDSKSPVESINLTIPVEEYTVAKSIKGLFERILEDEIADENYDFAIALVECLKDLTEFFEIGMNMAAEKDEHLRRRLRKTPVAETIIPPMSIDLDKEIYGEPVGEENNDPMFWEPMGHLVEDDEEV